MQFVQKKVGGNGKLLVCVVSESKDGKTRLTTSLPKEFGKILYVASDPNAESLASVLPHYRERISVLKPGRADVTEREVEAWKKLSSDERMKARTDRTVHLDPDSGIYFKRIPIRHDLERIATYPWANEGFGTLVWDTMSQTAVDLLAEVARHGIEAGNPDKGSGQYGEHRFVLDSIDGHNYVGSNRNDIFMTMNIIDQALKWLADQPIHVLINFHTDVDPAKHIIGPATIGKAQIGRITKLFDYAVSPESRDAAHGQEYWVRIKTFIQKQGQMKMNLGVAEGLVDVFKDKEVLVGRSEGPEGHNDPARYDFWPNMLKLVGANETETKEK